MLAWPSGIAYASSGTSPCMPSSRLCLIMMVGLSSRMHDVINPFMSYGFDGCTTLSPGMWQMSASSDWLCWAAAERPPPPPVLIVSGIVAAPPNMYFNFAAWLTIWSKATQMKSMNMMSTIGRRPVTAEPTPRPMIACSLIGVSTTRRSPNSACSPAYVPNTPPNAPMSSPAQNTFSLAAISWRTASLNACP